MNLKLICMCCFKEFSESELTYFTPKCNCLEVIDECIHGVCDNCVVEKLILTK